MDRVAAVIDLSELESNLNKIKEKLATQVEIMAVVKADAYGHGAVQIARKLAASCTALTYLGVASVTEATELRLAGITLPILILSECLPEQLEQVADNNLTQTVYNKKFALNLNILAEKKGKKIKTHLKIDTGMSRVGLNVAELEDFLSFFKGLAFLEIEGIFTHLACADEQKDEYTDKQLKLFDMAVNTAKKHFPKIKYVHAANSEAIFNYSQSHYNMVRPGIALYRNIMKFISKVNNIKTVPAGTAIGYGATHLTAVETKIATVAVGYADGYSRLLSGQGRVLIKGRSYPVVGNVCMDMIIVDVFSDDIAVGDEVVLIGVSGQEKITAQEIASLVNTIDYEIYCGIGKRVERYYLN